MQFIFSVNSSNKNEAEVRFINSLIKKAADRNKLRISLTKGNISSNDSVFNSVYIDIVHLKTLYPGFASNKFLGGKSVHRNINALINVTVQGHKYDFSAADTIVVNYRDRVDYSNIENIESGENNFTHAKAPKVSAYEEIVFPVTIVAVSVVAAILFFFIRSK